MLNSSAICWAQFLQVACQCEIDIVDHAGPFRPRLLIRRNDLVRDSLTRFKVAGMILAVMVSSIAYDEVRHSLADEGQDVPALATQLRASGGERAP